jgi:hypothetical protein
MNTVPDETPPPELKWIPYGNYEDVFSETEAAALPLNRGTYGIELVEGAALPSARRRHLMCCETVPKVCNNQDGFDSLPVRASVLFALKADGSLQLEAP